MKYAYDYSQTLQSSNQYRYGTTSCTIIILHKISIFTKTPQCCKIFWKYFSYNSYAYCSVFSILVRHLVAFGSVYDKHLDLSSDCLGMASFLISLCWWWLLVIAQQYWHATSAIPNAAALYFFLYRRLQPYQAPLALCLTIWYILPVNFLLHFCHTALKMALDRIMFEKTRLRDMNPLLNAL